MRDRIINQIGEAQRKRAKAYDAKDTATVERLTKRIEDLKRRLKALNGAHQNH